MEKIVLAKLRFGHNFFAKSMIDDLVIYEKRPVWAICFFAKHTQIV